MLGFPQRTWDLVNLGGQFELIEWQDKKEKWNGVWLTQSDWIEIYKEEE